MSPLDDELRSALSARAATVAPSPDPLAGIEQRAQRLRRNRTTAAALGAALAVAVVAVAVPSLASSSGGNRPSRLATSSPTSSPATATSYALDPAHPWSFRGTALTADTAARFQLAWSSRHPGSTLTPLFAQTYEPSRKQETAVLATGPGGTRYGWLTGTPSAASIIIDRPYTSAMALQFALAGDEAARLVVVTAPEGTVQYAADGTSFAALPPGGGIGVTPLDGNLSQSRVRVSTAGGEVVYDEPALIPTPTRATPPPSTSPAVPTVSPSPKTSSSASPTPAASQPANVVPWPPSGAAPAVRDVTDLLARFARSLSRTADLPSAHYRALKSDTTESGVRYTVGQAWFDGDPAAHDVSYAQDRTFAPVFVRWPVTPTTPAVLAFLLPIAPTFTSDLLVVVPRPGVGQVSYAPDATTAFLAVASGRSDLNGNALLPRPAGTTADRLEVLDGDGNLDKPQYRGLVNTVLCGAPTCG